MMYADYSAKPANYAAGPSNSSPYRSSMAHFSLNQPLVQHTVPTVPTHDASHSGPRTAGVERLEYKTHVLYSTDLESHLRCEPLVRDCAVIGVPQPGGLAISSSPSHPPTPATVPTAFVALSAVGRERSAKGGEKESKRMKAELLRSLLDFSSAFKQMRPKLMFIESIPRGPGGSVIRNALIDKAISSSSPPANVPSKGFFNTVLSDPASISRPVTPATSKPSSLIGSVDGSPPKKAVRDSKRRATHSQIERRRREKINDRLVTLRSIVPACSKELEDRRRQKQEEEEEAARIAAGGAPKTYIDAATGKPKRKRNRKKPDTKKTGADKEEELGLHKLEVLTHAINYIFELKAHIHQLEHGVAPDHVPTADNPFGIRNQDGSYRRDAKIEDEPGEGISTSTLDQSRARATKEDMQDSDDEVEDDEEGEDGDAEPETKHTENSRLEEEEKDEIEDDNDEDEEDELDRRPKKHMSVADHQSKSCPGVRPAVPSASSASAAAAARYRRSNYSSSSSRDSEETSPVFSIPQQSPLTFSPATTITSPMMSLSAESPILLPDPAIGVKQAGHRVPHSPAFPPLPASAIPLSQGSASSQPPSRRESSSFLFKQLSLTSPNFAPFNPLSYPSTGAAAAAAAARTRASTLSFPAYGGESELRETSAPSTTETPQSTASESNRVTASTYSAETSSRPAAHKTPGLSDQDPSFHADPSDASAAALLLNFSTSPEVLRPIGSRSATPHRSSASLASSPHARPVVGLGSRISRSSLTSPQYRPLAGAGVPCAVGSSAPSSRTFGIPGSAPGGSTATHLVKQEIDQVDEDLDLGSPPHLALDSSPDHDNEQDMLANDTDNTLEDRPDMPLSDATDSMDIQ